jgi:type VI secretion system Hcp family effector
MGTYAQHAQGKARFHDFTIVKVVDPTTPKIISYMFKGQQIKSADLIARRTGTTGGTPQEFLTIKFEDLLVASHTFSGNTDGAMVQEAITFRFRKIYLSASALKEGADQGAKHAGYDLNQQATY